eukprot:scaffold8252_cov92-Cylindrotheca_fusiformis.AAC.7
MYSTTSIVSTSTTNAMTMKRQIRSDEEIFVQALKFHSASLRYFAAGMFIDAIHSLLEGFQTLERLLEDYGFNLKEEGPDTLKRLTSCVNCEAIEADAHPFDGNFLDREELRRTRILNGCPFPYHYDLILAMIYNLGLAYHMYALQQKTNSVPALHQSIHLYRAAQQLATRHDSSILICRSLENNLSHVHYQLYQNQQKKERSLSSRIHPTQSFERTKLSVCE